ncbi:response regulator [Spirosoma agri]|uniref:Response regulator n=1 Tax=Spirosoma agri TaxID=1987381 RepID=A0A6M0IRI5_9BACT|nr:response regulator [Spirosoma agri]NEU69563.1 response regulator [Spirosoma agri]
MAKLTTPKRRKANRIPILIIEDNADQWLIIRSALSQCFPEVEPVWTNNATQALKYLEACSTDDAKLPRLILQDLYLPSREEGWGLLDSIKSHTLYRQIPLVILSNSQDHSDVLKSYTFSIASYIIKPITYHQWLTCFYTFRRYWWESVMLPLHILQTSR